MALVKVQNVFKSFDQAQALAGINLTLEQQKQYVISGASGSGKSTLLYLLAGLDRPDKGEVIVNGQNLAKYSDQQLAQYRNKEVGLVFQFHFLLPSMNCYKNILLPAQIAGLVSDDIKLRVDELSEYLGVTECLKKYPYQLSGGQQQRINLIRAVLMRPKLLLCDEPTGNLDSKNSQKVVELLRTLAKEYQATLVVVTHDLSIEQSFDLRFKMEDGRLVS